MKQVQWATLIVGDPATRNAVEALLNQDEPWELRDWQIIGQGVDMNNQPVVNIAVCMVREKVESATKSGK